MATTYRVGQRVREVASPHRRGSVVKQVRTGTYARVFVHIDGRGIVAFYPAQIALG